MDEEKIKSEGVKPLLEILHQVADMFPVQESAFRRRTPLSAEDNTDLAETIVYLSKLGIPSLISLGAGADDKDPDTVVVQASAPRRIGLPAKDYYKDDVVVEKYEATLAQIIENLHPDHADENSTLHAEWTKSKGHRKIASRGQSKDYAHEVIQFEKKLAAASPDAEDMDDVTVSLVASYYLTVFAEHFSQKYYNPMSLKDANKLTPQIHLSKIINGLAPSDYKTDRLIIAAPNYMENMTDIISSTSKEVLQSFFMWKVIQTYASVIEADEIKPYSRFVNEIQGRVSSNPTSRVTYSS